MRNQTRLSGASPTYVPDAIANMLMRSHGPFSDWKSDIIEDLLCANMVASAETVTRIKDTNGYRWVFMCDQAIVHQAQQSRAELVVREWCGNPELKSGRNYFASPG
jgi:hypothetical protein